MENSKKKQTGGAKPSSNSDGQDDNLDLEVAYHIMRLVGVGVLVLAVLAIGIGTYLNKDDDEGTFNYNLLFSNPDGLTMKDKCMIGLLGFLWLTGFAISIGVYLSKSDMRKPSNPSGLTKKEKCVLGVGFFALAVFTLGTVIYLNKEEGGVLG